MNKLTLHFHLASPGIYLNLHVLRAVLQTVSVTNVEQKKEIVQGLTEHIISDHTSVIPENYVIQFCLTKVLIFS